MRTMTRICATLVAFLMLATACEGDTQTAVIPAAENPSPDDWVLTSTHLVTANNQALLTIFNGSEPAVNVLIDYCLDWVETFEDNQNLYRADGVTSNVLEMGTRCVHDAVLNWEHTAQIIQGPSNGGYMHPYVSRVREGVTNGPWCELPDVDDSNQPWCN